MSFRGQGEGDCVSSRASLFILEHIYHSLKSESYSQRLTHFLLAVIHQRFSVYNFKKCCYNPIRSTESILNNKSVHT